MKTRTVSQLVLLCVLISAACVVQANVYAGSYRGYDDLMSAFRSLAKSYPSMVTYETVGTTVEGRSIILFKIGNPNGGRVYFDAAIHGDESLGGELLYAYAKWILTSNSQLANRILTRTYTLLVPTLNADGYNFKRTNHNNVDLNRNFATDWRYGGDTDPNSGYYRGSSALSEPESQTVVGVFQKYKPKFYINLHRGGSILYENRYGNAAYYSTIYSKITTTARQMGVPVYQHESISGAGFAMSDGAKLGITSYLLELMDWATTLTLAQIETVLLPKFIPIAATLSQECERDSGTAPSDINQDGIVDMADVGIICAAFSSTPGTPGWNPRADINGDNVVNMRELYIVIDHFGEYS